MNNQKNINQKGTFLVSPAYHKSSKFLISFDDKKSVSHAGLVLIDELANKLDLIKAADNLIDLGNVAGRANPGQKIMTLIESLVVGGDCIDDADILRSGSTSNIVSHKVMAPSTLGTFIRSFTFGHLKQLDKLTAELLKTAWNFNISSKNDNLLRKPLVGAHYPTGI